MKKMLLLLFATLLISCSSGGFKNGQTVYVSEQCIGAINEDSYDEMTKLCNRRDALGLEQMESNGLIKILNTGTKGVVVDQAFGMVRIRLYNGYEYWCANEFVK